MTGKRSATDLRPFRAVIGSILEVGQAAFENGAGELIWEHIPDMKLRHLYGSLVKRFEEGKPVGAVDMTIEVMGGPIDQQVIFDCLSEYSASVVVPSMVRNKVDEATRLGVRWYLEAQVAATASEASLEDYVEKLESLIESAKGVFRFGPRLDVWDDAVGKLERLQTGVDRPDGIATGFKGLDYILGGGGILPGQITILAARPGVGKSSLARQIALNAARIGRGAAIFSLEDGPFTYACRVFADATSISLGRMRRGDITSEELSKIKKIAAEIRQSPIELVCMPNMSSTKVASAVRARKRTHRCDLVVVDYINLIRESGKERRDQIDSALRTFVEMARTQNVAVVVCAQLNRNSVSDGDGREPALHDLKESGGLEQEGKAVLLVHRKFQSEEALVKVEKNNQGDVGRVKMHFNSGTTAFSEVPGQINGEVF